MHPQEQEKLQTSITVFTYTFFLQFKIGICCFLVYENYTVFSFWCDPNIFLFPIIQPYIVCTSKKNPGKRLNMDLKKHYLENNNSFMKMFIIK